MVSEYATGTNTYLTSVPLKTFPSSEGGVVPLYSALASFSHEENALSLINVTRGPITIDAICG